MIVGIVSRTGSRAARASNRVNISCRISADSTRSASVSGVPYCSVCASVLENRLSESSPVRVPRLMIAMRLSAMTWSSFAVFSNSMAIS
jgi:hypothetical protein